MWLRAINSVTIAAALLGLSTSAAADAIQGEIDFANGEVGVWKMQATTYPDTRGPTPKIGSISCSVLTNGMSVSLQRTGQIAVKLGAVVAADGDQLFTSFDVSGVTVGNRRYDVKLVSYDDLPTTFSDVDYPAIPGEEIRLSIFHGYQAVRARPGDPWLDISGLLDAMMRQDKIKLHLRPGRTERRDTYDLKVGGLSRALNWCQEAMASDEARRLGRRRTSSPRPAYSP